MPDIIEINDSDAVVRSKIIAILEFDGISTDDITSWGIATNRLNLAANRLGFNNITNNMPGSEARAIINQLAVSPAPVYPENTVLPTISGNARYNQTLTATTGTWNGYPAPTYSYQWQADEIPIPGATSSTYLIKESDLGKQIRVGVTATNLSGPASVFSNPTTAVTSTPINSSLPTISGTAANGQTLTANNGTWIAFPVPAFTYQWKADGVNIAGATNQTLALGNNQIGREITVEVTATNSEGFDTKTTNATARVTSAPINTVLPLVAAEIVEGKAVTTTSGTWLGYPVPTNAYQWKRNGTNISGATSSSYTPVSADVGQNITVTVTATNSVSAVQATSVAKMAKPAWAETFDVWRNFATNVGDLPNPEDIHPSNILAPETSGSYQTFAPNVLTRTDIGLQTVPTRTNAVPNSSMSNPTQQGTPNGWIVSSGGGITLTAVGSGIENGLPYVDWQYSGTATSNATAILYYMTIDGGVPASPGQTWTNSLIVKLVSGSLANRIPWIHTSERNTTNNEVNIIQQQFTPTTSAVRYIQTVTLSNANTTKISNSMRLNFQTGDTLNAILRVSAPQLELGSFATPPILTTGSSSTATGNRQFISGLGSQLANGVAGFVQIDCRDPFLATNQKLFTFDGGGSGERFTLGVVSNVYTLINVVNGSVVGGSPNLPGFAQGILTIAFILHPTYRRFGVVGVGQSTPGTGAITIPALTRLGFNGRPSDTQENSFGFSKKVSLYYLQPGDDPATAFANAYAKAQLAHAAP